METFVSSDWIEKKYSPSLPNSSPERPLACNWHYCAQFIAKPKAACTLRFSRAATSSNLGLWINMTSIKLEVDNVSLRRQRRTDRATAIGNTHKKTGEDRTCSSEDMIVDGQTHTQRQTDRHAHHNTRSNIGGGVTTDGPFSILIHNNGINFNRFLTLADFLL